MGMSFHAIARLPAEVASLVDDPETLIALIHTRGDDVLDLDKAWHGWHWLLTGTVYDTTTVLGQTFLGGSEIGEDLGYGPARVLSPEEVQSVATALELVDARSVAEAYDPQAMDDAGIYPTVWARDGDEGLRWLLNYLPTLKSFYRNAATSRSAVVLLVL